MTAFTIVAPGRILFGRGEAARAASAIKALGNRIFLVHGADGRRADWLVKALRESGRGVLTQACPGEPDLALLDRATQAARDFEANVCVGIGGGAALDLAKAVAALAPAPGNAMDHLEVVGNGLPLVAPPLPFVALPTTSGTGAEATKNAVIGLPDHGRKVSLRDDRMIARVAIIDPALTDHLPRSVTLASGLDAITQVIEPYLSSRANAFTDSLTHPAIARGLAALIRLMEAEDPKARDEMAWVSLCGGLALANGGLGAVHGLAGVLGGSLGAAHGAICGALIGPVLRANAAAVPADHPAAPRIAEVQGMIGLALGCPADQATQRLADWAHEHGLTRLSAMGLSATDHRSTAEASLASSSMKGNPVPLSVDTLIEILERAG
jgi:alcohol dehydrogenase class IV